MPKKCPKFISEFLIPHLDSQNFGKNLKWINKEQSIFQLDWCHKNKPDWTEGNAEVFVEWDKLKGHYQPQDKIYYTKSKQRFRSLLYKLTLDGQIKKLKSENKYKKIYSIVVKEPKRRTTSSHSTDSGFFNADDMSSEDMNSNGINEPYEDNFITNNLNDHNYSRIGYPVRKFSDSEDQTVEPFEDVTISTSVNEILDQKVVVKRNYPHDGSANILVSKDMNNLNDLSYGMMLIEDDSLPGNPNLIFSKAEDSVYGLTFGNHPFKNLDENKTPTESEELPDLLCADSYINFEEIFSYSNSEVFSDNFLKTWAINQDFEEKEDNTYLRHN